MNPVLAKAISERLNELNVPDVRGTKTEAFMTRFLRGKNVLLTVDVDDAHIAIVFMKPPRPKKKEP